MNKYQRIPHAQWIKMRGTEELRQIFREYRFVWPKHSEYVELIPRNEKEQDR